jgi:hypothetical protein
MTRYQELSRTWFEEQPRRLAIDRILRALPTNMRDAIRSQLEAPSGLAQLPTTIHETHTGYVELYWPRHDPIDGQKWDRCEPDCSLRPDEHGVYSFHVGICAEKGDGFQNSSMLYVTFTVEAFDDRSLELQIRNLDGTITIDDANSLASYSNAAKEAIDRLLVDLKNPRTARGSRSPIGFTFPREP